MDEDRRLGSLQEGLGDLEEVQQESLELLQLPVEALQVQLEPHPKFKMEFKKLKIFSIFSMYVEVEFT
jgi:hypothetical protein